MASHKYADGMIRLYILCRLLPRIANKAIAHTITSSTPTERPLAVLCSSITVTMRFLAFVWRMDADDTAVAATDTSVISSPPTAWLNVETLWQLSMMFV